MYFEKRVVLLRALDQWGYDSTPIPLEFLFLFSRGRFEWGSFL